MISLPSQDASPAAGTLFIVSAPSGAGKTSLVKALLGHDPDLHLAVSCTTRAPRPGELDGVHYHFVDDARFEQMVLDGAFLEHATVFGSRYGTTVAAVRDALAQGRDLLLEIDWQGARQVRARWSDAPSVFILPPSLAALEQRLRGRNQDSEATIARRMAQARDEVARYSEYDYLLVNDDFDQALQRLVAILVAERLRRPRQQTRLEGLLAELTRPSSPLMGG